MKNIIVCVVGCFLAAITVAQKNESGFVTVNLKNTSFFSKKVTVVSYQPGETGNGTNGFVLMPGSVKRLQFKEGTKLYLASDKQVDTVMSGKSIDGGKPFLMVKKVDNNKFFNLQK